MNNKRHAVYHRIFRMNSLLNYGAFWKEYGELRCISAHGSRKHSENGTHVLNLLPEAKVLRLTNACTIIQLMILGYRQPPVLIRILLDSYSVNS